MSIIKAERHPQRTLRIGDPVTMSPTSKTTREEIKARSERWWRSCTSIKRSAEAERQREYQLRPLCVWLEDYRTHVLGTTTRHRVDEYAHAKSALLELEYREHPPVELNARGAA